MVTGTREMNYVPESGCREFVYKKEMLAVPFTESDCLYIMYTLIERRKWKRQTFFCIAHSPRLSSSTITALSLPKEACERKGKLDKDREKNTKETRRLFLQKTWKIFTPYIPEFHSFSLPSVASINKWVYVGANTEARKKRRSNFSLFLCAACAWMRRRLKFRALDFSSQV